MARSTTEIKDAILASKTELYPELSDSAVSEWRIWIGIFAIGIHLFELILDLFTADVENKLKQKQPGSLQWYIDKALEFQQGDSLIVDEYGVLKYELIDSSKNLVKFASVQESSGQLILKVATIDSSGDLVSLNNTNGEFLEFQRYIENVKFAGTDIDCRSQTSDIVDYDISIYFDPMYLESDVQTRVLTRLDEFRTEIPFDGSLYQMALINALLEVEGVKTVKINSLNVTPDGGAQTAIDVYCVLASGYFNFSGSDTLTMIDYKTV